MHWQVAASLVVAAGLPWNLSTVVHSAKEYEDQAVAWLSKPTPKSTPKAVGAAAAAAAAASYGGPLRAAQVRARSRSKLFDGAAWTRDFERTLLRVRHVTRLTAAAV